MTVIEGLKSVEDAVRGPYDILVLKDDNILIGRIMEDKIFKYLTDKFEKELFIASLENLKENRNKLRFNNFAYSIRELTRHFLKRLSPDENIKRCSWYKNETGEKDKISRGERVTYAIQGGLEKNYVLNTLGVDVSTLKTKLSKVIKKLNKYTHICQNTFDINNEEIEKLKIITLELFLEFFELIESSKRSVIDPLKDQIDNELFSKAIYDFHQEIDLVATHHYVEGVDVYEHEIDNIDFENIYITAYGNLETTLEYGSGSDHRRGDGASFSHSWPFTCKFISKVKRPKVIVESGGKLEIDESSWYGE